MSAAHIVLRSAGERTVKLACDFACRQVGHENVTVIEEVPFSKAVVRTFEVGVGAGCPWTIGLDADVLLSPHAVETLVRIAEEEQCDVFEIEGRLFDKVFQGPRHCGLHLYRTSMLDQALSIANRCKIVHRPEFYVIQEMQALGYRQRKIDTVVGIHDFEQSYRDLYRKGFVHAQKHSDVLPFLQPMWERLAESDSEFQATILGLQAGRSVGGIARTDVRPFGESINALLQQNGLAEREPLVSSSTAEFDIELLLGSLEPAPEFQQWERSQRRQAKAARLMQVGFQAFQSLPLPVQHAIRVVLNRPVQDEVKV